MTKIGWGRTLLSPTLSDSLGLTSTLLPRARCTVAQAFYVQSLSSSKWFFPLLKRQMSTNDNSLLLTFSPWELLGGPVKKDATYYLNTVSIQPWDFYLNQVEVLWNAEQENPVVILCRQGHYAHNNKLNFLKGIQKLFNRPAADFFCKVWKGPDLFRYIQARYMKKCCLDAGNVSLAFLDINS